MRRALRVLGRLLVGLLVVLAVAVVAGYWWQRPMILTGTGYAAHNECAVRNLAGRDDPLSDLPDNPLVPYLGSRVHGAVGEEGAHVTASMKNTGLAGQEAFFTPGVGCTLAQEGDPGFAPRVSDAASFGPNPLDGAPVRPLTGERSSDLDRAIDTAFGDDLDPAEQQRLGTRAVVVVKGDRVVAERYAPGFDADAPQLGWSMSKSATNLYVGRLVQEGKVDIHAEGIRPEWTEDKASITLDDLLRMQSGLAWDETYELGTPITEMLYRQDDMGDYAAARDLAHPVGAHRQYSTGSTQLVCDTVRQKLGVDDRDEAAALPYRWLLEPLGLRSARWEPDASGTTACGSYLWMTPRDWAALGMFARDDGRWDGKQLLPKGWMRSSTTEDPAEGEPEPYGSTWWLRTGAHQPPYFRSLPKDTYWMSGHDGQRTVVVPSADLVVVRMGFSPTYADQDPRVEQLVRAAIDAT